jgi:hypothetical protein
MVKMALNPSGGGDGALTLSLINYDKTEQRHSHAVPLRVVFEGGEQDGQAVKKDGHGLLPNWRDCIQKAVCQQDVPMPENIQAKGLKFNSLVFAKFNCSRRLR